MAARRGRTIRPMVPAAPVISTGDCEEAARVVTVGTVAGPAAVGIPRSRVRPVLESDRRRGEVQVVQPATVTLRSRDPART
ncbi:hypothetical protein Kisp01_01390 [Kineosporia sp. NBRC 101677]|nr:hypothetical protein Kisp01_01390 [Kineosporia sp. NBRC 101677]